MIGHIRPTLALGAALLSTSVIPALGADVTIRITGSTGGTASVVLDTDTRRWAGTNGPSGDLLKARSGTYKAGTNVVPGFAVKGTGLFVGSDEREVEAFFYDLIPTESRVGDNGRAHMLGTGNTGTWTRR
jgi:hypothetical protein